MLKTSWLIPALMCLTPVAIADDNSDKEIGYISLYNFGSYVIDPIVLHWKTPEGEKKSKKMGASLLQGDAFCYDIAEGGDVPDGSEVWLVGKIVGGDNENCRKDSKHIYTDGQDAAWFLKMAGSTLNGNRCQNDNEGAGNYDATTNMKGNSNLCENLNSY